LITIAVSSIVFWAVEIEKFIKAQIAKVKDKRNAIQISGNDA
jgi:hypothetical protein